jgi:hypothetical protein
VKTTNFSIALFLAGGLMACSFSAGTKTDLKTGLQYSYYGLSLEEVYFVGPENTPLTSNDVAYGSVVALVAQGIGNFQVENNRVFPGLSLSVTGEDGSLILNEPDLLTESEGFSPEDASIMRGSLTIGEPMEAGNTYKMKVIIWDKKKPQNKIESEVPIHVVLLPE